MFFPTIFYAEVRGENPAAATPRLYLVLIYEEPSHCLLEGAADGSHKIGDVTLHIFRPHRQRIHRPFSRCELDASIVPSLTLEGMAAAER